MSHKHFLNLTTLKFLFVVSYMQVDDLAGASRRVSPFCGKVKNSQGNLALWTRVVQGRLNKSGH